MLSQLIERYCSFFSTIFLSSSHCMLPCVQSVLKSKHKSHVLSMCCTAANLNSSSRQPQRAKYTSTYVLSPSFQNMVPKSSAIPTVKENLVALYAGVLQKVMKNFLRQIRYCCWALQGYLVSKCSAGTSGSGLLTSSIITCCRLHQVNSQRHTQHLIPIPLCSIL